LLVLWTGPALGPGSAPLVAEAWRWPAGGAPARIWSSTALFPEGLAASEVRVARHELAVRYEVRLPGLAAGCQDPLEHRDVFRPAPGGERLVLARREVRNGWRRELQVALGRLLRAVEVGDGRALAQLAPRPDLRGRLPRALTAEPACETTTAHAAHEPPRVVVTAATAADGERPRPWSLEWSRVAGGWRLTDAYPVLK
jgi:hypothetical protein